MAHAAAGWRPQFFRRAVPADYVGWFAPSAVTAGLLLFAFVAHPFYSKATAHTGRLGGRVPTASLGNAVQRMFAAVFCVIEPGQVMTELVIEIRVGRCGIGHISHGRAGGQHVQHCRTARGQRRITIGADGVWSHINVMGSVWWRVSSTPARAAK